MTEIRVEDWFWQGDEPGVVATWYFQDGDAVTAGVAVAELMFEKAQIEIPAPASGTLKVKVRAETPIRKGDVIGAIE